MAQTVYNERYRPQFHFTARENWLNDPNGLVYYKGEYHLFFQHNPKGIDWGNMTWGHAVSPDLIHWEQLANALEPDETGTMFSGSAVVDWDNTGGFQTGDEKALVAIYTAAGDTSPESAGKSFTQCIASSNDRGRAWHKFEVNPVLAHIAGGNRDPKVVWHDATRWWIMALFLDGEEFGFFASPDLKVWTHLHNITATGCGECPDFFPMTIDSGTSRTKWVWTAANGRYLVGDFDGHRFVPDGEPLQSDYGANFYAVQTFSDVPPTDGRRIQIAWMNGGKYPDMPFNQQMSFPCELTLRSGPDGPRLYRNPVQEISLLREPAFKWHGTLERGERRLSDLAGELFDIQLQVKPGEASEWGLTVGGESIRWSSQDGALTCLGKSAPVKPIEGRIELRVLVDRTSLELYANHGAVSMSSCYIPTGKSEGISLFAAGGEAEVEVADDPSPAVGLAVI